MPFFNSGFLLRWFFLFTGISLAIGSDLRWASRWDTKSKSIYSIIYVDKSGRGNFSTIQAAINSIPIYNRNWVIIHIKRGVYSEKVVIPYNKPFIVLQGEGQSSTLIVWNGTQPIDENASFTSRSNFIIARKIGFVNSYNSPRSRNPRTQAVAALVMGDKTAFYDCAFRGLQDTLWDYEGRHYYKNCTIVGGVDFIFGHGQSLFEECQIVVDVPRQHLRPGFAGYITAQTRAHPNDPNGFVFKGCSVSGRVPVFLGRALGPFARVIFHSTNIQSKMITPEGWDPHIYRGHENQLTFVESQCYGPGADRSKRVIWEKKVGPYVVQQKFANIRFIDGERWL